MIVPCLGKVEVVTLPRMTRRKLLVPIRDGRWKDNGIKVLSQTSVWDTCRGTWLKKGQGPRGKLERNEKLSLEVNIIILQKYVKRRALTEPKSAGLRMGGIQCKTERNCFRTC